MIIAAKHSLRLWSVRLTVCGLLLPVCGWAAPPAQDTAADEQRVLELVAPARELAQQGRITDAITAIWEARKQLEKMFGRPDHWSIAYAIDDLARYRRIARDFQGSYEASGEAVEIAEHEFGRSVQFAYFVESNSMLGYAAGRCGDARKSAEAAFNIYAAADPRNADTQRAALTLINLLLERDEVANAVSIFQRVFGDARSSNTSFAALAARTRLSLAEGKPADAEVWLRRAEQAARSQVKSGDASRPVLLLLRAELSAEQGDVAESERLISQMLTTPQLTQMHRSDWLQALQQQAQFQAYKGEYADALTGYTKAFQEYAKEYSGNAPPMTALNRKLGGVYQALGDFKRAEAHFTQALSSADACFGPVNSLSLHVLYERARVLLDAGRPNEALADADRAARDAESVKTDRDMHRAYALSTRALVYRRFNRLDEAQSDLSASLDALRAARGVQSWELMSGYTELADLALRRKDFSGAQQFAQAALAIRERDAGNSVWSTALPVAQLMDIAASRKNWTEVGQYGERIVGIVQGRLSGAQARSEALTNGLRQSRALVERVLDNFSRMPAGAFAAQNGIAQVFAAAQSVHLTESSSILRLSDEAVATGNAKTPLFAQWRSLLDELQTVQSRLQGSANGQQDVASTEATQWLLRRSVELEAELAAKNTELQQAHSRLAESLRPSLQPLDAVQSLLEPDEALYLQVVTDEQTYGVLLRADAASFRSSSLNRATVRRNVTLLRRSLDSNLPPTQRLPFDYKASNELYAGTLGQFSRELAGVHDLTVILDDAFQNLPPALLVKSVSKSGASGKGSFLGELFGLAVAPSVDTFKTLRARDRYDPATQPFIGFANPKLTGSKGELRSANALANQSAGGPALSDLQALPPLPDTADELERIAQGLAADGSAVRTQAAATESAVKSLDLSNYQVVSFATHGVLAGEFRGLTQPALVMTPPSEASNDDDGLLTAPELAVLKFRAELVILPACNTGRSDEGGGAPGLAAIAHGFFFAGADSLVASHWLVPSDAAVALVSEALRAMNAEPTLSKAQALRRAMVRVMQGAAGEQFRNPAYWAPFVLIGDARPLSERDGRLQQASTAH